MFTIRAKILFYPNQYQYENSNYKLTFFPLTKTWIDMQSICIEKQYTSCTYSYSKEGLFHPFITTEKKTHLPLLFVSYFPVAQQLFIF